MAAATAARAAARLIEHERWLLRQLAIVRLQPQGQSSVLSFLSSAPSFSGGTPLKSTPGSLVEKGTGGFGARDSRQTVDSSARQLNPRMAAVERNTPMAAWRLSRFNPVVSNT